MNVFLTQLQSIIRNPSESSWETTLNISQIKTSNTSFNKIPDDCSAYLDIRFIPEEKDIVLKKIQSSLLSDFYLEVLANEPSVFVEPENTYIKKLLVSTKQITGEQHILYGAQGTSDGRHFSPV